MKRTVFLVLLAALSRVHAESITLHAGDHDRTGGVVTFQGPVTWKGKSLALQGVDQPLQVDDSGRASFNLSKPLKKGENLTFILAAAPREDVRHRVQTKVDGDVVKCTAKSAGSVQESGEVPVFSYQMQAGKVPEGTLPIFAHGAHLHPVFTPSGRLVTGNHPVDHPHQRGIWFAWTHTEFEGRTPDYWNMGKDKSGGLTGEVRFDKLLKHWSGPVHGGFVSTHRWIDHTSGAEKDMLQETWEVTVTSIGGERRASLFLIDLVSSQMCASDGSVKLPKYHYGGLGVRGNALWDPVDKVQMLTSNGDDRVKGDGTKAKWVWLGGEVDGGTAGITVLIHPENFRFPQPLRLNPKNPQLCVAPSADGDWSIEPGKPYVSRYRLVISDGKPDAGELERLWVDYAEPVKVEVAP